MWKSLEAGRWLPEEPFEMADDFPAAQVSSVCSGYTMYMYMYITIVDTPRQTTRFRSNTCTHICMYMSAAFLFLAYNLITNLMATGSSSVQCSLVFYFRALSTCTLDYPTLSVDARE